MKSLATFLLMLLGHVAGAQIPDWDWATSGTDGQAAGQGIARTAKDAYTVVGHFQDALSLGGQAVASNGGEDVLLVQYDAQGQPQWARQAGGPGHDGAMAIANDAAGNFYVAGYFSEKASFDDVTLKSAGSDDVFLAKYRDDGKLLWVQQAGGSLLDYATAVAVDSTGAVFVAGQYQGTLTIGSISLRSSGPAAGFLAKYDAQGKLLWAQSLPDSFVSGLATDGKGDVYAAGTLAPTSSLLAKFDAHGTQLWTSPAAELAAGTCVTTDRWGDVYVAGRFLESLRVGSTTTVSSGSYDGFLARFDPRGAGKWVTGFGGPEEDQARGVAITAQGNVGVTGYFRGKATVGGQGLSSGMACAAAFVSCYAPKGNALWVRSPTGTIAASGAGLVFDTSGEGAAVTGTYQGQLSFGSLLSIPASCSESIFTAHLTTAFPDLIVAASQSVEGSYHNVTVTGTGTATLTGPLQVSGTLTVQGGGVFDSHCQPLSGPGSFVLEAGAGLRICHPDGIAAAGASGAVQLTGGRSFSPAAHYVYSGTLPQQTGTGLPSQARTLTLDNRAGLVLTSPLSIVELLRLTSGNLVPGGQMLTLLSNAAGTAQVDNAGGIVQGAVTVQRYIDPSLNAGTGYRHFSAPVQATTVADLTTALFTPVTNPAYNATTMPGSVQPFPTVLGYDERRLAAGLPADFDQGWYSPASSAAPLEVMRGYSVNLAGNQAVDFVGELNNGPYSTTLTRGAQADAGWNLIGNPYPATLDWSRVAVPAGLANSVAVFQSSGPYTGQYRSYVNGVGNPLIALGQGFMVRPSASNSSVVLTLSNSARSATFSPAPVLNRVAADARPLVQLSLLDAGTGIGDETTIYFEAGATSRVDAQFDALSPPADSVALVQLGSLTRAGEQLAINGLPLPTAACTVPLRVQCSRPGQYRLTIIRFVSLSSMSCYLLDSFTGRTVRLSAGAVYPFQVAPGEAAPSRFSLRFVPATLAGSR
jgi:hypothetical protein